MATQTIPPEASPGPPVDANFGKFSMDIEGGVRGVREALQVVREYFAKPAGQVPSNSRHATAVADALNSMRGHLNGMLEEVDSFQKTGRA